MKKRKRYLYLIMGILLLICMGLIYGWSVFVTPLEQEFGWNRADTSLVFVISMISYSCGTIGAGILNRKINVKVILAAAAVLFFAGFLKCANAEQLYEIYLYYGGVCGLATGAGYNTVIYIVNSYFRDRIGFASGCLTMAYGLGAFLLGSIVSGMTDHMGFRAAYQVLAFLFGAVFLLAAVVLKPNKQAEEKEVTITEKTAQGPQQMLVSKVFWKNFIWAVLICSVCMMIISNAAPISIDLGVSAESSILFVGCVSVCNGAGRIIFGSLLDYIDREPYKVTGSVLIFLCTVMITATEAAGLPILLMLGYGMAGLAFGSLSPYAVVFTREVFGEKYYAVNFSIFNTSGIPASIIGSYVISMIYTINGTYMYCFAFSIVIAATVLIMVAEEKLSDRKNGGMCNERCH